MTAYMKAIIALLALAVCGSAFGGEYEDARAWFRAKGEPLPTLSGTGDRTYTMTTRDRDRIQIRLPVGLGGQFIQIERPDGSHVSGRIY